MSKRSNPMCQSGCYKTFKQGMTATKKVAPNNHILNQHKTKKVVY